jgi:hypothetical protein
VNGSYVFTPELRVGLVFHVVVLAILLTVVGAGFLLATRAIVSLFFLVFLIPALIALVLIPIFLFRGYSLYRAQYILERDGLRLRWGLREEVIPMNAVRWVYPAHDWEYKLPRPRVYWPGAILGSRQIPDGVLVEYLAGDVHNLMLVATQGRIYAISPSNPQAFLSSFQSLAELGSLTPLSPRSAYAASLLNRVWDAKAARYLLLAGGIIAMLLLILVGAALPFRNTVSLGFQPDLTRRELVPSVQLILLPVLNFSIYMADLLAGMFFFRQGEQKVSGAQTNAEQESNRGASGMVNIGTQLAYLLWVSAVVIGLMFLTAFYFIVRAEQI